MKIRQLLLKKLSSQLSPFAGTLSHYRIRGNISVFVMSCIPSLGQLLQAWLLYTNRNLVFNRFCRKQCVEFAVVVANCCVR